MDITNEQWQRIAQFIPKPKAQPEKSVRPPQNPRDVLNDISWILRTGAQWSGLPARYPPRSTFHLYFQQWNKSGVFIKILTALVQDLKDHWWYRLKRRFYRRDFCSCKKKRRWCAKPKGIKKLKIWFLSIINIQVKIL
ncbi:MAG: transposase [Sedimentisphaerales bacterium]|nr:transposase [Sedimentisphaerales bacterium]